MGALTPEIAQRDYGGFLAFLDAQPHTDQAKGTGVQGYCIGRKPYDAASAEPAWSALPVLYKLRLV